MQPDDKSPIKPSANAPASSVSPEQDDSQPEAVMPQWLKELSLNLDDAPEDGEPVSPAGTEAPKAVRSDAVPAGAAKNAASVAARQVAPETSEPPVLLRAQAVDTSAESTPLHAQASESVRQQAVSGFRDAATPAAQTASTAGRGGLITVIVVVLIALGIAAWWMLGR